MLNIGSCLDIGVLTFHRCINYGSYWQARCLVEGLRARGHNAVILDHNSPSINRAEWKCALEPVLPQAQKESDRPLYRKKIRKFFSAFDSLPLSARFSTEKPAIHGYDLVIVGSDEVWNLLHPWYGRCPMFYGDGIRVRRLISYAASFGNYSASAGLEQTWADKLQKFHSISVRDENSQTLVRNAIGIEPIIVLDPCLQFVVKSEEQNTINMPIPYAAVYGHNFSEFFAREARRWAAERKLPLISIGYRNDWADEQWINAGPQEFASFMAQAEAVATNFFHGCIFALRNATPFVCETSPYRSNKLQGLLTKIEGEKHMLTESSPAADYNACLNEPLSPRLQKNIYELRQTSNAFLDQVLGSK
jgi:hypothetical protein